MKTVLCVGEALIDRVTDSSGVSEHVGGSVLSVACGLARLGHPTRLASWWGRDERGAQIERHLADHGVMIQAGSDGAAQTSVANASIDAAGSATYDFDLSWDLPPALDVGAAAHVHVGSLGATVHPGADRVRALVEAVQGKATVSYDPNVRPALMTDLARTRRQVEQIVAFSDVVKASDEDIASLYGDRPAADVAGRWLDSGAGLVVVTAGGRGATAWMAGSAEPLVTAPARTSVVDTVGAGDSFMAGLLSGLLDAHLLGIPAYPFAAGANARVSQALRRAAATSARTVAHRGAYAPARTELT